jgi:UDP-N-acetylglucosamine--N-acetylmuramyl-(pentapeptide) pyrophosphoryl-undecaprenol N-acetylglucosamine transferase
MSEPLHILFGGGGTGGHLFPGLAVAEELARQSAVRIIFCGPGQPRERAEVARAGYQYLQVPAAPLLPSPIGLLRALYFNGVGYRAARRAIRCGQPDLVVGLGGYASVPLGLAAARLGVPLVLLEQNVIPGRANRMLGRWADTVCVTFPASIERFATGPRLVSTGNPIRRDILQQAASSRREPVPGWARPPELLILGGSQGARSLNRAIVEALPRIEPCLGGWHITHQTGPADVEWLQHAYAAAGLSAEVTSFIRDMAAAYSRASLAVSRAGATTLSELAVMGVPAILLPYPHAAANHQWHNARVFEREGAASVVEDHPEPSRTAAELAASLLSLLKLAQLRAIMSRAMLGLARPCATPAVASEILSLATSGRVVRQSA